MSQHTINVEVKERKRENHAKNHVKKANHVIKANGADVDINIKEELIANAVNAVIKKNLVKIRLNHVKRKNKSIR